MASDLFYDIIDSYTERSYINIYDDSETNLFDIDIKSETSESTEISDLLELSTSSSVSSLSSLSSVSSLSSLYYIDSLMNTQKTTITNKQISSTIANKNLSNKFEIFTKHIDNTMEEIKKSLDSNTFYNDLDKLLNSNDTIKSKKSSRDTSGPSKTKYDKYIYNHFPIETLTSNKEEWRHIIKDIKKRNNDPFLIKRLKQIRRRELQKQYNKGLRDRKRNEND